MRRLLFIVPCAVLMVGVAGCQTVTARRIEYYEPTKETLHKREDGNVIGALKCEIIRDGARDEGDKTFAFGLLQNVND